MKIRAGQEFSDATALMESAKMKHKPLLLKKKKKKGKRKTKSPPSLPKQNSSSMNLLAFLLVHVVRRGAMGLTVVNSLPGGC